MSHPDGRVRQEPPPSRSGESRVLLPLAYEEAIGLGHGVFPRVRGPCRGVLRVDCV